MCYSGNKKIKSNKSVTNPQQYPPITEAKMPLRKRMRQMTSDVKEITEMPEVGKHRPLAMAAAIVTLCIMGVIVFFWMATTGWEDEAGIAVATIFVLLAASQCAVAVYWWRSIRPALIGIGGKSDVDDKGIEFKDVGAVANEEGNTNEKVHMLNKDGQSYPEQHKGSLPDPEVTIVFPKDHTGGGAAAAACLDNKLKTNGTDVTPEAGIA